MTSISVIIPAYNAACFIAQAIESAIRQTCKPSQIIIVDDGSSDATADIAEGFGPPVQVLRQTNKGVSAARNIGIAKATGDLIAFLDADDLWRPTKLEQQLALLQAYPEAGTVICDELHFTEEEGVIVPTFFATVSCTAQLQNPALLIKPLSVLIKEPIIPTSGLLVRNNILKAAGLFDENLSLVEDRDMWLRLAALAPVLVLPEVLVEKRQNHGSNLSKVTVLKWAECLEKVFLQRQEMLWKALVDEGSNPRQIFAMQYSRIGHIYWYNNRFHDARRCFGRSLRLGGFNDLPLWLVCLLNQDLINKLRNTKQKFYRVPKN